MGRCSGAALLPLALLALAGLAAGQGDWQTGFLGQLGFGSVRWAPEGRPGRRWDTAKALLCEPLAADPAAAAACSLATPARRGLPLPAHRPSTLCSSPSRRTSPQPARAATERCQTARGLTAALLRLTQKPSRSPPMPSSRRAGDPWLLVALLGNSTHPAAPGASGSGQSRPARRAVAPAAWHRTDAAAPAFPSP